ncbi:hypothetical protein [Azospirillum doebereinerae]
MVRNRGLATPVPPPRRSGRAARSAGRLLVQCSRMGCGDIGKARQA